MIWCNFQWIWTWWNENESSLDIIDPWTSSTSWLYSRVDILNTHPARLAPWWALVMVPLKTVNWEKWTEATALEITSLMLGTVICINTKSWYRQLGHAEQEYATYSCIYFHHQHRFAIGHATDSVWRSRPHWNFEWGASLWHEVCPALWITHNFTCIVSGPS